MLNNAAVITALRLADTTARSSGAVSAELRAGELVEVVMGGPGCLEVAGGALVATGIHTDWRLLQAGVRRHCVLARGGRR